MFDPDNYRFSKYKNKSDFISGILPMIHKNMNKLEILFKVDGFKFEKLNPKDLYGDLIHVDLVKKTVSISNNLSQIEHNNLLIASLIKLYSLHKDNNFTINIDKYKSININKENYLKQIEDVNLIYELTPYFIKNIDKFFIEDENPIIIKNILSRTFINIFDYEKENIEFITNRTLNIDFLKKLYIKTNENSIKLSIITFIFKTSEFQNKNDIKFFIENYNWKNSSTDSKFELTNNNSLFVYMSKMNKHEYFNYLFKNKEKIPNLLNHSFNNISELFRYFIKENKTFYKKEVILLLKEIDHRLKIVDSNQNSENLRNGFSHNSFENLIKNLNVKLSVEIDTDKIFNPDEEFSFI